MKINVLTNQGSLHMKFTKIMRS